MSEGGRSPKRERAPPAYWVAPEWATPATRLVHGGQLKDLNAGAVVSPIYQTSTFHYPAEFSESAAAGGGSYLYTRHGNPNQEAVAELIRDLEGGEAARVFGSGMGAISTTLLTLLTPGKEVVALESLYGGTLSLLSRLLPRLGVRVRWISREEVADPDRCVGPETALVFLESPTNPTLELVDLERWAEAADRVGALSVVDNTFATPVNQRPIPLGVDLVVHSATKYLGGHSDLLAGAVVGPSAILERIRETHLVLGSVLDPFAAFLLLRGMRTLEIRVDRASRSAALLAERLAAHPQVARVCYPGRESPAAAQLRGRQMRSGGAMLAFTPRGGIASAHRLLRELKIVQVASSLGGVESLASLPGETSHANLSPEELLRRGIDEGMVRLSVGIEDVEDLWRDLREALDAR